MLFKIDIRFRQFRLCGLDDDLRCPRLRIHANNRTISGCEYFSEPRGNQIKNLLRVQRGRNGTRDFEHHVRPALLLHQGFRQFCIFKNTV